MKYTAKKEKENSSKKLLESLEQSIQEVFESDKWKEYLDTCSKFHHYSVNNCILILIQKKDATQCASFNAWKKLGRTVKHGEKGIRILAPAPFKKEVIKQSRGEDGAKLTDVNGNAVTEKDMVVVPWYKVVYTFDISQTEGKELPGVCEELKGTVDNYEQLKDAVIKVSGVPVKFEEIDSGAKGFYSRDTDSITVKKEMENTQTIKTLVHEMTHAKLHSGACDLDRKTEEVQAESTAYVVCKHFGIDTDSYSFEYLAGWSSGKELKELKQSMNIVQKTADEFINAIEKELGIANGQKEEVA